LQNYYDKKFNTIIEGFEYTSSHAVNEIVHRYLDDKPNELRKKDVLQNQRDEWFWNSQLLQDYKDDFIKLDTYPLALTKNLKNKSIYQIDMIKEHAYAFPNSIKEAIKYSKIFLDVDNENYIALKGILNIQEFQEFFYICDSVTAHYDRLKQDVKEKEKLLMNYGYVDLLFLMALSSLKYANINIKIPSYIATYGMVLTKILQDRIKKEDRRKKSIERIHLDAKVIKYFMENMHKKNLPKGYELFEDIFKAYESITLFEQNELSTFLYDANYSVTLDEDKIVMNPIDMNKHINISMHSEKLQGMFTYYEEEAMIVLEDVFEKEYNGKKENYDMNFFQLLGVLQTKLIMSEIFGLKEDVFIDDDKTLHVGHLIYTGFSFSSLYFFEFLRAYLPILQKHSIGNWWQAHTDIISHSMLTHKKNRNPLVYKSLKKEIEIINKNQQIDFGEKLIDFWSHELETEKSNNMKPATFFEKPFIKINDFVFVFPWLMSFTSNSPMIFINSLLRVHTNRKELLETNKKKDVRKEEVCRSEKNLAAQFSRLRFSVEDGYKHSKEAAYHGVQDIDIVASKDGHLFILELKSTYIRESLESNWLHKTGALRKAGNQLLKRKRYIEKLLRENNKKFIEKFGKPEYIHTWIVDTSFESDHEYFSGSLKVSMFEMIYALNETNNEFYPNGFNVSTFVKNIESAMLWEKINRPQITQEDSTYTVTLK